MRLLALVLALELELELVLVLALELELELALARAVWRQVVPRAQCQTLLLKASATPQ